MIRLSLLPSTGLCALSGKEGDGYTVVFDGEKEVFLSHKAFKQIVAMKAAQGNGLVERVGRSEGHTEGRSFTDSQGISTSQTSSSSSSPPKTGPTK